LAQKLLLIFQMPNNIMVEEVKLRFIWQKLLGT